MKFNSLQDVQKQFDEKTIVKMIERHLEHLAQQKDYHKKYNAQKTEALRLAKQHGLL